MNPSIFDGDGRCKVAPVNAPDGTRPMPVTRAQARMLIASWLKGPQGKKSFHSSAGSTVWVALTYCIEQELAHNLICYRSPCFRAGERFFDVGGWAVEMLE